jgi:hypothetical protein
MRQRTHAQRRQARRQPRPRRHTPTTSVDGWTIARLDYSDIPLGPDVHAPSVDAVVAAIAGLGAPLTWPAVAGRIVPLLERSRPYPPGAPARASVVVPPGVTITMAIDVGPGYVHVAQAMVDDWPITVADVAAQALVNVYARAAELEPSAVVRETVDGVPVQAIQTGLGIGSVLVLAPTEVSRLFGHQPALFVAPMRDLLLALPPGAQDVAAFLFGEIAAQDPNHLEPRVFIFDGTSMRFMPLRR